MAVISFVEETTSGGRSDVRGVEVPGGPLPLRELVRRRVLAEVAARRARPPARPEGPVRPGPVERSLDGERPPAPPGARSGHQEDLDVDARAQVERAWEAFAAHGFFVLVDDHQVRDLDEPVDLRPGSEVVFLTLVPLVGG